MAASGSWIVMPFFCSISLASNWRALDMPQPRDSAFDAASFSAFCWSCGRGESARVLATTAFFGWKALVLYEFLPKFHSLAVLPVADDVMLSWMAPRAS